MRSKASDREKRRPSGVWRSLRSTRLTIGLLIAIAFVCILGSFIPQNVEEDVYLSRYGAASYDLLRVTGATDLYHSPEALPA